MMERFYRWLLYKSPHLIGAMLGVYALFYTHISLAQLSHERRIKELERLTMIGLLDAESGQRAYLLTDDPLFLSQYRAGLKSLATYEPVYKRALIRRHSRRLCEQMEAVLKLKTDEMALTISTRDHKGTAAATAIVKNRVGDEYTEIIFGLLLAIRNAEAKSASPVDFWTSPNQVDIHDPSREWAAVMAIPR